MNNNQSLLNTDSRIEENKWNMPFDGVVVANNMRRESHDDVTSNGGFLYSCGEMRKK